MDSKLQRAILDVWSRLPDDVRSPPASEAQLKAFEDEFLPIPQDYRWFLGACGGGPVGHDWMDSITELRDTHVRFREEIESGYWAGLADVFVVAYDGAGNPYGIHKSSGKVLVQDHDFGGVHELAASFEEYLRKRILE
jgi:SMI1/KNR4 family protein SUKH-1